VVKILSRKSWKKFIQDRWSNRATHQAEALLDYSSSFASPSSANAQLERYGSGTRPVHPKLAAARAMAKGIEFLVPEKDLDEVFLDSRFAEVVMLPQLIRSHKWAMPEHELLVLGAMVQHLQPKLIVEFGTFRGGSTLVMASNQSDDSHLITIDLEPTARKTHEHGAGVGLSEFDVGCLFRPTRYAARIEQRFANSVQFDDRSLIGAADFVLVDADHTYEFAKRDTAKALQFLKPGGTIVWHDYTWLPENSECAGVTKAVNEFYQEYQHCSRIRGTRFAVHQDQRLAARRAA
jgi:predicted O-methyltransferase YrrM